MDNVNKITRYKESDNLDLEKLIADYSSYVYKIIENMTGEYLTKEDKEEIISDTFFTIWKNKDKIEDEKLLSSYLAGITKNLVKLKARTVHFTSDISNYENSIQDFSKIDLICEEREKIAIIEKALTKMKEKDVFIFYSYYYSSMKIVDIAKKLNVSEFTIKSRLYRVRKKLRKELEKGGYSDVR